MSVKILLMTFVLTISALAQTSQWRLIWDKNLDSDSVLYYEVYRDSIAEPNIVLLNVNHIPRSGDDTTMVFTDSTFVKSLGKGKRIYYRLKAVNLHGSSGFSETVDAVVPVIYFPYDFYLPPSATVPIPLINRVQDPTTDIHSMIWDFKFPTGFDTAIVEIDGNPVLRLNTPASWKDREYIPVTVTNKDEFFDSSGVTLRSVQQLISGVPSLGYLNNGQTARISWQTVIPTSGQIHWGTTSAYGNQTNLDSQSTAHTHAFSVVPGQEYHYRIDSDDYYGIMTSSTDFTFTAPQSSEPVTIQDIQVQIIGGTDVQISWATSAPSIDYVEYGLSTSYGDQTEKDEQYKTDHLHSLEGLEENSTYHFRIVSESEQSILTISNDSTFASGSEGEISFNVYPIPLELSNSLHNKRITFEGIPLGGSLYIFNLMGDLVFKKTNIQENLFYWNAVNNADRRVHTGVYLYLVKTASGKKFAEDKVIVIY